MSIKLLRHLVKRNLKANRKLYLPYIVSGTLLAAMFFMIDTLLVNPFVLERMESLSDIIALGQWIALIFTVIFMFYANNVMMKSRRREFGLYSLWGLEKKHVAMMLLSETAVTAILTIVGGLVLGSLFNQLNFMLLNKLLRLTPPLHAAYPVSSYLRTLRYFTILYAVIGLWNGIGVNVTRPIKLLKEDSAGEKTPPRWVTGLVFLLGIGTLGAGYYIALSVKHPLLALRSFFVAVILVIIGTLCLYTAGSVVILSALKRWKGFYYRPTPFLSVSSMIYRMRENAVGLANVAILVTMVIIPIATTGALYLMSEQTFKEIFPTDFEMSLARVDEESISDDEFEQLVEEMACQVEEVTAESERQVTESYTYHVGAGTQLYADGSFYKDPNEVPDGEDGLVMVYLFDLEDYQALGGEERELAADEVLFRDYLADSRSETMTFGEQNYQARPIKKLPPFLEKKLRVNLMEQLIVVFPTAEARDAATTALNHPDTGFTMAREYQYNWDVDGSSEQKIAYGRKLDAEVFDVLTISHVFTSGEEQQQFWMEVNGGFLFLGLYMGSLFLLGTVLIIYFKQISEAYSDRLRIQMMEKVGLDRPTIQTVTRLQLLWLFILPLVTATIHTLVAYPILDKLLKLFGLPLENNFLLVSIGAVIGGFAVLYLIIYQVTSRVYLSIVRESV